MCVCDCVYHCAQLLCTIWHRIVLIIFPLILQTVTTAHMLSTGGERLWVLYRLDVLPATQPSMSNQSKLELWVNAQRDGRPAEYRWRRLFNAAVWLTPTNRVPCSNAAKTRNPLKLAGVPQTNERISATRGPKFTILYGHVEEVLLLNKFFSDCRYMP